MNFINRLLGRKTSRTTRIDTLATRPTDAVWTPREYQPLASEGYQQATWVYACIRRIVDAAVDAPVLAFTPDGETELPDHDVLTLLRRPNPWAAQSAFTERALAYYLLSGNTYVERVGPQQGPPLELYAKRPDRMRVLTSATEFVRGYRYTVNQEDIDFLNNEILHVKSFHPLDDFYGMSPIEAAARGVDAFNTGMAHNVAIMQNGARPSGAWVTEQALDTNQFNRFRQQIHERNSLEDRGKELLLEAGVTWEQMGLTPKDLDWLAGLQDAGRQIHAVFGVHPVLTGLQEGTYENQEQAKRGLYLDTALPLLRAFLGELSAWLSPLYPQPFILKVDTDQIPALSDDQDSLFERAVTGYREGILTLNEARAMTGYEEMTDGDTLKPTPAPVNPNDDEGNEGDDDDGGDNEEDEDAKTKALNLRTAEQKTEHWRDFNQHQNRWEARYRAEAERLFRAELRALQATLGGLGTPQEATDLPASIMSDAWLERLSALNLAVAEDFGMRTRRALLTGKSASEAFKSASDLVITEVLRRAGESVTGITSTTRALLRLEISEALQEGESLTGISKRVDRLYLEQIIPNRSLVIARTEVIRWSNAGNQAAAKATGLDLDREWITTVDGRERSAHAFANGQRRPMGTPFDVGGERLMHPGDPNGSAGNTIQCRCVEVYHTR